MRPDRSEKRPREGTSAIAQHAGSTSDVALTLHIGTGKTGTSSLQNFLARNRARLAESGWLYPRSLGRTRHVRFGLWTRSDDDLAAAFREGRPGTGRFGDPAELRREVPARLLAEVRRTALPRVLISDEALYAAATPSLERLRRFINEHASQVRVICYLRRQDDLLVSHYQQVVKVRATRTLAQRVAEKDLSPTYDYYARLRSWGEVIAPDELIVRRFEPARFRHDSLYDDFVDAAGLEIPTTDRPERERNESLDAEAVEFLRLLNLYRVEHPEESDLPANRDLVPQLTRLSTGPILTLPDDTLDQFMEQWADSNERVARELLGEPSGGLFSTERKTSGTTTDQRLDPARLDRYLEALEALPARIQSPLRRIAEREADRQTM